MFSVVLCCVCVVWYAMHDNKEYESGRRKNLEPAPRALNKQSSTDTRLVNLFSITYRNGQMAIYEMMIELEQLLE